MSPTTILGPLTLSALAACWLESERGWERRFVEMQGHEVSAIEAITAIGDGDLKTARRAGRELGREDQVPLLPDEVRPILTKVRAQGRLLSKARSLEAAARAVVDITEHCSACHQALEISRDPEWGSEQPVERAWQALVFADESQWVEATGALDERALRGAPDWASRRVGLTSTRLGPVERSLVDRD